MSQPFQLFTVGIEASECYGHGDFGKEVKICRMGSYGSGEFPPFFATESSCREWLAANKDKFYSTTVIVPVTLML